jgi:hypothetical protein
MNNVIDRNDPYAYRLVDIVERRLQPQIFYEIYGAAVDLKDEWREVIAEAQRERQHARWSWDDDAANAATEEAYRKARDAYGDKQRRYARGSRSQSPTASQLSTHYAVLGLPREATKDELKRAFRQLALKLHPDVNADPDAAVRFVAVRQAYQALIVIVPD